MVAHLCHFLVDTFAPNPTKKKDAYYKFCNSAQDYLFSDRCLSSSFPNRIKYFGVLICFCVQTKGGETPA